MATTRRVWTREEVLALIDPERPTPRLELLDGDLFVDGELFLGAEPPAVTPSPRPAHQEVVTELLLRIGPYVKAHRLGRVGASPADLSFGGPRLVQPDVFVARRAAPIVRWEDVSALLLAIEVLSPKSAQTDRVRKRLVYQRTDVAEYWIVDADARIVERWRPADERPDVVAEVLRWQPEPAHPPLEIDLVAMFKEALDG